MVSSMIACEFRQIALTHLFHFSDFPRQFTCIFNNLNFLNLALWHYFCAFFVNCQIIIPFRWSRFTFTSIALSN